MSNSYTDVAMLFCGKVTTPTNGTFHGRFSNKNWSFMVTSLVVVVEVAGAQAASELFLETNTPTTLTTVAMGTSVAGTVFQSDVPEASRELAAGTIIRLRHNTTDASAVYYFQVWGTYCHM